MYSYVLIKADDKGFLHTTNAVAEKLSELPVGKWVLPGGIKPGLLVNDEGHGKMYPTLPRFTTDEVRVIIQIIQPRMDSHEQLTWYLGDVVNAVVSAINDTKSGFSTHTEPVKPSGIEVVSR